MYVKIYKIYNFHERSRFTMKNADDLSISCREVGIFTRPWFYSTTYSSANHFDKKITFVVK